MLREAPAMTVRQNLGELLNEVQYKRDQIVITKAGKPVAALIDIRLFERLRQMEQEFERMTRQMQQAFQDMQEADLSDLLDEAIHHSRNTYKAVA
ncbi:MAG: prevent-host-death protein [Thiothrix lacustris]|uniref:Antitoxin n=1 Tax=Thiothrix lacustris TaxID=525917 RepID=A0A1Y1QPT0_9GAMM|nr:MAG: prevent-host-death protein [Thiothrix lacustris]